MALRFRWRLIAAAAAAGIIGAPQSVLAQTCSTSGIDPVTVACSNPGGIMPWVEFRRDIAFRSWRTMGRHIRALDAISQRDHRL